MKRHRTDRGAPRLWGPAVDDARRLALDLVDPNFRTSVDVMSLGLAIAPDETAYRYVSAWVAQYNATTGYWGHPSPAQVLLTDRRVVIRQQQGPVVCWWWSAIIAIDIDLANSHLVLDFGDGEPYAICGAGTLAAGVVAVAVIYGADGLLRHAALGPLRH